MKEDPPTLGCPTPDPARTWLWIAIALLMTGASLWAAPTVGKGLGLGAVDTNCFGNHSVPPDTYDLTLVKAQDNIYTMQPCQGLTASVTITSTVSPAGLVTVAPAVQVFTDLTRRAVVVNVEPTQVDPFTATITYISTSDDKNFEMPTPDLMPAIRAIFNPPLAVNDDVGTSQDVPIAIPVLTNDIDRSGTGLHVMALTLPAHGTAVISPSLTTVIYTPTIGYWGSDQFTYTVKDGNGNIDAGLVTVLIAQENAPPPIITPIDPYTDTHTLITTTITAPQGQLPLSVIVEIPANAFTITLSPKDILAIVFTPIITPTGDVYSPPNAVTGQGIAALGGYRYAHLTFSLDAYLNGTLLADFALTHPITVTVNYPPALLSGLNPATLQPFVWSTTTHTWGQAGIDAIQPNPAAHSLTFQLTKVVGEMSFFAKPPLVYIPFASKP